jgi:hypothetical protein
MTNLRLVHDKPEAGCTKPEASCMTNLRQVAATNLRQVAATNLSELHGKPEVSCMRNRGQLHDTTGG